MRLTSHDQGPHIQLPEQVSHGVGQRLSFLREQDRAMAPLKECSVQVSLKVLDLVTDGPRRHEQFLCRPAETEMAGSGLEGSQGIERCGVASLHEQSGSMGLRIVSH